MTIQVEAIDRPRPRSWEILAAILCVLPSCLQLRGAGSGSWYLILIALLILPALAAAPSKQSSAQTDKAPAGRFLFLAVLAGFLVPLLPQIAGQRGFNLERVVFGGVLARMFLMGAMRPSASRSLWPRLSRSLLIASAIGIIGSTWIGYLAAYPSPWPWTTESLGRFLENPLGQGSLIDPARPLSIGVARLEYIALAWGALETGLRDEHLPRKLARAAIIALPLGLLVNLTAATVGSVDNPQDLMTRLDSALDRVHAPLPDHNSLGSALVIFLPLAVWFLWARFVKQVRKGPSVSFSIASVLIGLAMLYGTSSKSAFVGLAAGMATAFFLSVQLFEFKAKRFAIWSASIAASCLFILQLIPAQFLGPLLETRYVEEVVRAARLDLVSNYLEGNRYPIWSSGFEMVKSEPVFGVGLGRFPVELTDLHDPADPAHFNPITENAHNQYLQWAAEEGLPLAALSILLFALAIAGAIRAGTAPPPVPALDPEDLDAVIPDPRLLWCALAAAMVGLAANWTVGHALLVPAIGGLWAICLGVGLSGGALGQRARASRKPWNPARANQATSPALTILPATGVVLLAAFGVLSTERPAPESVGLDLYPWVYLPDPNSPVDRARMIGPDAAWIARWGTGDQMMIQVKTIMPSHVDRPDPTINVYLQDTQVLKDFPLPRKSANQPTNPWVWLKIPRPKSIAPGDLFHLRIQCDSPYTPSDAGSPDTSVIGLRMLPPIFRSTGAGS